MHLELSLPSGSIGLQRQARRSLMWKDGRESVTTDSGVTVSNTRWKRPRRLFEVALPDRKLDHPDFLAIQEIFLFTEGGTHSFNFADWIAGGEMLRVRFMDSDLEVTSPVGFKHHVDTFVLVEERTSSPGILVAPAITGTLTVGQTLTVSNGAWSGSPTSYARRWYRNDVEIAGATANSYVLQAADAGKKIRAAVIARDAAAGETMALAPAQGPIAP